MRKRTPPSKPAPKPQQPRLKPDPARPPATPSGGFGSLFAIVGSIASSVAIVMVNKHVLGSGFPFASTLTALHQLFGFVFTNILIWWGVIPKLPPAKPNQHFSRLVVATLYASGLVLMNQSLALNSVSFYQLLKMSCIPAIAILQFFLYGTLLSTSTAFSLVLILAGVFITTTADSNPSLINEKLTTSFNANKPIGDNILSILNTFSPVIISILAVLTTSLSQILLNSNPDLKRLSSLQSIAALSFASFLVCGTSAIAIDVGIYPGDWIRLGLSMSGVSSLLYSLVPSGFEWLLFSGEDLDLVKVAAMDAGAGHDYHEFLGGVSSRAYLTEHLIGKFISFLTKLSGSQNSGVLGAWVLASCLLSVLTNLFGFAVIKETSAMTYQVVGHAKTVLTLAIGALLFGADGMAGTKGAGILIALAGMVFYSKK
ncbi:hypothetical protein BDR26DRAFT_850142 [Obelidium mucronatum]|nr:hypothetical protein BDR26DRAFT_850142 [Obelidium mucronatum]